MSPIITPGSTNWRAMEAWCDAYAVCIEVQAQAAHDPEMRRRLHEASAQIKGDRTMSDQQRKSLGGSQDRINQMVKSLTMDDYHERKALWATLRRTLQSTGWDLQEEIHFEQVPPPKGGILVYQDNPASGLHFGGREALLVYHFLEFVAQTSEQLDPQSYVKKQLLEQGVNAQNFHEHAESLLISNPWA